ncbi:hypothetical protein GOODEAATRI_033620 [Goodea atripinnis]|uniref:Uncharacterized protein n=1 Tax=Goodea atripinnis TaxID=208336 RepID=A0ABV0NFT7_9TELE
MIANTQHTSWNITTNTVSKVNPVFTANAPQLPNISSRLFHDQLSLPAFSFISSFIFVFSNTLAKLVIKPVQVVTPGFKSATGASKNRQTEQKKKQENTLNLDTHSYHSEQNNGTPKAIHIQYGQHMHIFICFTCLTYKISIDTLPFTQSALIKAIHKPHQLHTFFTLSYSHLMFFPGEFEPNL